MTAQPLRFFVGVGATKAGTTWVSEFLRAHPEAHMSPIKELHYFNSLHAPSMRGSIRARRRLAANLRVLRTVAAEAPLRAARLAALYTGLLAYRTACYRPFLETGAAGRRAAGEITPAYSLLPEAGFAAIERALPEPRYLFVMRNPVDRFWSQVRFSFPETRALDAEGLARFLDLEAFRLRSDYAGCLTRLRAVAPAERVLCLFYEDLFDPERHEAACWRLCDFLGLTRRAGMLERRVNRSVVSAGPTPFDRARAVAALASQYAFCAAEFGDALPAAWRADMALLEAA